MAVSSLLFVFFAAAAGSFLLTKYVRDLAARRHWALQPRHKHHRHAGTVPRLGGIAIFTTVVSLAAVTLLAPRGLGLLQGLPRGTALGILAPAALIFLTGLYDDTRSLGPYPKFAAQILAAVFLYTQGFGIRQFDLLGPHHPKPFLALLLTVFWVVLITNAFNLIDGLDGLAAGSALFSTLVVLVLSLLSTSYTVSFLAITLAGAILGFLRFNFNPATIFLGDSGSLFIGFMLSALALAGSQKAPTMVAVAIPVVSFGLPIMDVAIAVVRRFLSGKPLFRPDNEHIHHKLLKLGFSQRQVVFILYGISALLGLLSLAMLHGAGIIALVLMVLGAGMFVGVQQLRYHEFFEVGRVLERTVNQKRIIENNLSIRRAADSLSVCSDAFTLCSILTETWRRLEFDGFGFRLPVITAGKFLPLTPDAGGTFSCHWDAAGEVDPRWELHLELVSSAGCRCGVFSVYRRLRSKPLLMDLNLLSGDFHTALADAVDRAVLQKGAVSQRQIPQQPEEVLTAPIARTVGAS